MPRNAGRKAYFQERRIIFGGLIYLGFVTDFTYAFAPSFASCLAFSSTCICQRTSLRGHKLPALGFNRIRLKPHARLHQSFESFHCFSNPTVSSWPRHKPLLTMENTPRSPRPLNNGLKLQFSFLG